MRKTTIVAAVVAATFASANLASASERLAPGVSVSTKSQSVTTKTAAPQGKTERPVNAPKAAWVPPNKLNPSATAAAFTSARTAPAAARPQVRTAAAPITAASKPERRVSTKSSSRRVATRRLSAKTQVVALHREIDTPEITGSADRSAAVAAPTGSIPSMVTQMAHAHGVSPALAHAVVKVESRYQPRATGKGGYIGLMQLSYQTARGMGFRGSRQALYEPRANLTYGMKYLAGAVAKSGGSTCAAVSKYQGGHGVRGVTRAGAVYCAKVKRFMAQGVPASGGVTADAGAASSKS